MRFTDSDMAKVGLLDFKPRNRSRHNIYLIGAFICTIIAVYVAAFNGDSAGSRQVGAAIVSIIIIVLCLVSLYARQRNNDLVLATEFQCMLYSAAAGSGSLFYLIIKHDGTVVHASRSVGEQFSYFPYTTAQSLDGLFIEARIPKFDQDKITDVLRQGESKSFIMKMSLSSGITDIVVTIDPLLRPSGYSVLRARYFSDKRGNANNLADIASDTFRSLLDDAPTTHFVADEFGMLRYVNPAFARLCGYDAATMTEERMQLRDVLYLPSGAPIGADYEFDAVSESVILGTRTGERLPVRLALSPHRSGGRVLALVGTVTQA